MEEIQKHLFELYGIEQSWYDEDVKSLDFLKAIKDYKRAKSLAQTRIGTGHDTFTQGIVVQFDLTFSIKAWTEAERYHFFDFVSSQSTMHRITKFDIADQCNEYVTEKAIENVRELVRKYNADQTPENYLTVLYNIPTGFRLTARMTTNYRQLKTIYYQRKNHRLPEWRMFTDWIETLPYFREIIIEK